MCQLHPFINCTHMLSLMKYKLGILRNIKDLLELEKCKRRDLYIVNLNNKKSKRDLLLIHLQPSSCRWSTLKLPSLVLRACPYKTTNLWQTLLTVKCLALVELRFSGLISLVLQDSAHNWLHANLVYSYECFRIFSNFFRFHYPLK